MAPVNKLLWLQLINFKVKEISTYSSIIPGILIPGLVTATSSTGLTLQVFGSFDATIDLYHFPANKTPGDFRIGQKVKARVLYDLSGTSPPHYALSLKENVVGMFSLEKDGSPFWEKYPIGTMLNAVKVKRVEAERGLIVGIEQELEGHVHVSLARS
jgi:rRNA biogenesis protein RRP5